MSRKFRVAVGILAVLVLVLGGPLSLVLLLRIFSRNREALLGNGPFRALLKRYNGATSHFAGTPWSSYGLLTHVGRRSGRNYQTPLGVTGYRDGFLVPLTYGPHTDWYRNLTAAQGSTLAWKGRTYQLWRPAIISGPEPLGAWPIGSRILLQSAGIHDFVWLHRAQVAM